MRSKIVSFVKQYRHFIAMSCAVAAVLGAALLHNPAGAAVAEKKPVPDSPAGYEGLIRFHVIANSDTAWDQAMKRSVRDAVVVRMTPVFKQARTIEEARQLASSHMDEIKAAAEKEIARWGADYPVSAELGRYDFPVKTYGELTLPAGNYEAVRIVIGSGQGANWWCVLFPPMCFVDVSRSMGPEDSRAVPGVKTAGPAGQGPVKVKVKYKVLEILGIGQ